MSSIINSDKTYFEKLILNINDYNKSKINSDEILYKGKMYDVKSVSISGNKVELTVINDIYEENILIKIKKLITNTNQNNKENPVQLQKLISLVYLSPYIKGENIIPYIYINIYQKQTTNIDIIYPDVLSPPPELV